MVAITRQDAVAVLVKAVEHAPADELIEIYNELFPLSPTTPKPTPSPRVIAKSVTDHIRQGLEVEELVDLWNVVFPQHRSVHFDDDTQSIVYKDTAEPLQFAD